jgi:hypothetical protein
MRRLDAEDALVLPEDPRVDLGADFRIDAVDGDRHVVDVVLAIRSTYIGSARPLVDTHSLMSGAFAPELRKVSKVFGPGWPGVAGSGDAEHRHLRNRRRPRAPS